MGSVLSDAAIQELNKLMSPVPGTGFGTLLDAALATAGVGDDVQGPAANTADYVPQWDGADSKLLKNGLGVGTSANNLMQLTAAAKAPAVDGSLLTAVIAAAIGNTAAPASASASGVAGQIAYADGYLYVCVATDTWQRVAIATWS